VGDWNPVVSPDGRTVAFIRWTDGLLGDIYLIPFGGGETKRLTFDGSWFQGSLGCRTAVNWYSAPPPGAEALKA
jgi:tricorn protease-like protein